MTGGLKRFYIYPRSPSASEVDQKSRVMRKPTFCIYAKTKTQISLAVTAKLISAFVFAIWIVEYLFFLNTKFQASSHQVAVRPGLCQTWSESTLLVFSCCGSKHLGTMKNLRRGLDRYKVLASNLRTLGTQTVPLKSELKENYYM